MNPIKVIIAMVCLSLPVCLVAASGLDGKDKTSNQSLKQVIVPLPFKQVKGLANRVTFISQALLGRPYQLGPLGEGGAGRYDQSPLYRFDVFDCQTFVETVMALALSESVAGFKQQMRAIRYKNGHVSFLSRNHFPSKDWNINNRMYLVARTKDIVDHKLKPIAKTASARIDVANWLRKLPLSAIKLPGNVSLKEKQARHNALKQMQVDPKVSMATIDYLPLDKLFVAGTPVKALFKQIPHGAIIELVRPNWDLRKQAGTHLNVSHMGFAIRKNNTLYFRNASSISKQVIDIELTEYLRKYLSSKTVKGINVQLLRWPKLSLE